MELVQLNPGSLVLEAKGLTRTPGYPTLNPASAHSPVCLNLTEGSVMVLPGLHFVAAPWIEREGQRVTLHWVLVLYQPLHKRYSHLSCDISIILIIPILQMKNWDSKGLNALLNTSERQCWHLDLHLFVSVRVPALAESILPPQSQVHPLNGRPIQQPEMTSHVWTNRFTNKCCLNNRNEHGKWGKKDQWNSNTTAK